MENAGINVESSVQQSGNYVAGRDIIISKTKLVDSKSEFIEIDLKYFETESYLEPVFLDDLLEKLSKNRIIIISGHYGFDKNTLVKYLAFLTKVQTPSYSVKEWINNSNIGNLFPQLVIEKKPIILVINQINPQNINYDLKKLVRECNKGDHIIIASTDSPVEVWKLNENTYGNILFDIPSSNIYTEKVLKNYLWRKNTRK